MRSRRYFVRLSLAALAISAARAVFTRTDPPAPHLTSGPAEPTPPADPTLTDPPPVVRRVWVPLIRLDAPLAAPLAARVEPQLEPAIWVPLARAGEQPADAPILGAASGSAEQTLAWLVPRAAGYTLDDVTSIVAAYQRIGDTVGLDWFLALAQLAHETGSLTSWWSQRPRRNPAGIGVTGATRDGLPDGTPGPAPGPAWAWDDALKQWREGVSFATWVDDAIPAHLGRLLAYALRDDQASSAQQELIARALAYRSLPASYRGVAPTITGLNGRWAVPGTDYGQQIMALAQHMRES
jgi:hypothetical protein